MKSDARAFRKRAKDCRDLANQTKDETVQRELRDLAKELDDEAGKMNAEETSQQGSWPN